MAAKPTEQFTVALTTSWINWASINTVEITATNPSNALAPSQVNLNIPFNWKDQVVVALGFSYSVLQESSWKNKDRLVLRAGYNYSNNPIPKETLSPLWPLINEHHFSVGLGFRFTEKMVLRLQRPIRPEEQRDIHQSLAALRAKRDRIHQRLYYLQHRQLPILSATAIQQCECGVISRCHDF